MKVREKKGIEKPDLKKGMFSELWKTGATKEGSILAEKAEEVSFNVAK